MTFWQYVGLGIALFIVIGFLVLVGSAIQTMKDHPAIPWFIGGILSGTIVTSAGFFIWLKRTHKI